MARPRNQTARRQQLLEAALQVINTQGPAGMQMKDVADAAGLATGSVYYYYDNVDELLEHVHALAFDRYYTDRAKAVAEIPDVRDKVVRMVQMGLPAPEDQPLSLALYQVIVAKARDPRHSTMVTDLCGQQVTLYQQLLDEGTADGHFRPLSSTHRIAEHIIALEDGYGLGLVTGNHDYDYDEAVASVLEAVSLWTQCPELVRPRTRSGGGGHAARRDASTSRRARARSASR